MRILCVEDDVESREMMTILLGAGGCEVVTASGTTDALNLATKDRFALIILDNWLEMGSGVELCKKIRGFDPQTPIVFYSAAAYEADVQRAMKAGAQYYFTKPLGLQALVQTIKDMTHSTSRQSAAG